MRIVMGDDEAEEFLIILYGYSLILSESPSKVLKLRNNPETTSSTPCYFTRHNVFTASWSFAQKNVKNVLTSFEMEPKLILESFSNNTSDNKTHVATSNVTDNIDNFVKKFMTHAAPSNEPEISLEELMKYIIPPPPPPPKSSPFNNLELPPKNLCKLPPKLPPKSAHIKSKFSYINTYCKFLDDLLANINISKNIVREEYKNIEYHLINHELIVQTSKLVTTSKLLLVSMSEKGDMNNQQENTLELCKLSIQKVFDLIIELKYSPEMIEYSNMLLTKLENVLVHFSLLLNSDLSIKHELSSNAEKIADDLALFLRALKQFQI